LKKVTPLFEPLFFMFSKEETHSKGENHRGPLLKGAKIEASKEDATI